MCERHGDDSAGFSVEGIIPGAILDAANGVLLPLLRTV